MAAQFLSTADGFLFKSLPSAIQSSCYLYPVKRSSRSRVSLCKAIDGAPRLTKRDLSVCLVTSFVFSLGGREQPSSVANAAVLEADDDVELLEKVKKDRKRRLDRQGIINSSKKETGLAFVPHSQTTKIIAYLVNSLGCRWEFLL